MSAFMLALSLNAEVVIAPSCYRNSYGLHYDMDAKRNQMEWYLTPASMIWDIDSVIRYWGELGVRVHKTPLLAGSVNLTVPATAYPAYETQQYDPRLVARLDDLYIALQPLSLLTARARAAVAARLRRAPESLKAASDYVVLDLPCTFFAVRTSQLRLLAPQVARALPFNTALVELAARTVVTLRSRGLAPFNGVHLRIEKDAEDWSIIMGGPGRILHMYMETMRATGFNESLPLYAATALLTYDAGSDWENARKTLMGRRLCSDVVNKAGLVPRFELARLNTEQNALVDFLILGHAEAFVGFGSSTFSYYLTQHRLLHGVSPGRDRLVDASKVGTNDMFLAAAVVVQPPTMHVVP